MIVFYIILFLSMILGAAGHVMLKVGAEAHGVDMGILRLNKWIALGVAAMVGSMLLSVRGLSVVPLRDMAFIWPLMYIAVPTLSRILLKERFNSRTLIGILILLVGMMMFNVPIMRIL